MKMHRKQISQAETEIISMLEELSLTNYTLISSVKDGILEEYEGHHIERSQWDIRKLYEEIIKPFHSIKINKFSPGIYSFWGTCDCSIQEDYRYYLLEELQQQKCVNTGRIQKEAYEIAVSTLKRLIKNGEEVNEFCLLHGDLYNGNILVKDNRYAIIDFEYVKFGPPLLEWAFVLFWDAIVEKDQEKQEVLFGAVSNDIVRVKKNGILNAHDIRMIFDLYLPVIACCVFYYCEKNAYEFSKEFENAMNDFWRKKYYELKDELYE